MAFEWYGRVLSSSTHDVIRARIACTDTAPLYAAARTVNDLCPIKIREAVRPSPEQRCRLTRRAPARR